MQKCKDDEHSWIVIEWVKGTYDQGQFQPGMMTGSNQSYRATEFLCQKCLARDKAERLLLVDKFRRD